MNWAAVDPVILLPALIAGLLVLSTHVPLGQRVLKRGIIFVDLAIAQVAGLGVIIAAASGWSIYGWRAQVAAASAAIVAAFALSWTEKHWPEVQEALIGVLFVLAATASLLVLAGDPHGGDELQELLVGQVLWVTYDQLWPVAILYALILTTWYGIARSLGPIWFYGLFAIVVTASVQLIGVYLVFACLIVPALATRRLSGLRRLLAGYTIGILGFALGLVVSALSDLPTGAVIVWTLTVVAIVSGFMVGRRQ